MKKKNFVPIVASLVFILIISGCTQTTINKDSRQAKIVADVCGNSAEITAYTLDFQEGIKTEAPQVFEAKCNIFTKCAIDYNKTPLIYTKTVDDKTESKIFGDIDFKAYLTLEPELDGKNETSVILGGKEYKIKVIDNTNLIVDGITQIRDKDFTLGDYTLRFFDYQEGPIFQALVMTTNDVLDVILDPEVTYLDTPDENGFVTYSVGVIYSNETRKKFIDLTKNMQISIVFRPTGPNSTNLTSERRLKSRLYYYAEGGLLSSVFLPVLLKEEGENIGNSVTINARGSSLEFTTRQFKWLIYSLKLATFPEVKQVKKETVDCTQLK